MKTIDKLRELIQTTMAVSSDADSMIVLCDQAEKEYNDLYQLKINYMSSDEVQCIEIADLKKQMELMRHCNVCVYFFGKTEACDFDAVKKGLRYCHNWKLKGGAK